MKRAARSLAKRLHGLVHRDTVKRFKGRDPNAGEALYAVYANFDPQGRIHDFVVEQVQTLAAAGYRVIFITQSEDPYGHLDTLRGICAEVVQRRNYGHDFGAFRFGLKRIRALSPAPRAVLLMNDSCYGFFRPLAGLDARVGPGGVDLWGLTDSYDHGYHLQSYFLLVSGRLFADPTFAAFWRNLPPNAPREQIIHIGEIGLTQEMLAAGFTVGCLAPYEEAVEHWLSERRFAFGDTAVERRFVETLQDHLIAGRPVNPSHYFWDTLLVKFGVHLVKRDLVNINPVEVPGLHKLPFLVAADGGDFESARLHRRNANWHRTVPAPRDHW